MPPKPPFEYAILGAGRQGTAAAYDLARFGQAARIFMADINPAIARLASERVNRLVGRDIATPRTLDVTNPDSVNAILGPVDAAMSAVPYMFNLEITRSAIATRTHLCDLGGHTDVVLTQLALDDEARQSGVSVVPDCGMGPGLINTMTSYVINHLDRADEVYIYDGGLPQQPVAPWNYQLTFHINGLTNEMDGQAVFLRHGRITRVDTLTEPELIDFPPFGKLEADVTSGGTSTSPWTFEGRLQRLENRTLRYPGHFEWLRAFKTLGLFSEEPLQVHGETVIPRQVFHTLLEPKITAPVIRDVAAIRVIGKGLKNGKPATVRVDLIDYYDENTGFTAMERLTGWHCALMMSLQARGVIQPGCSPVETAVDPAIFMEELRQRGIQHQVFVE